MPLNSSENARKEAFLQNKLRKRVQSVADLKKQNPRRVVSCGDSLVQIRVSYSEYSSSKVFFSASSLLHFALRRE